MTIKAHLEKVSQMINLLVQQRSSAAIDGLEGDNTIIDQGINSFRQIQEMIGLD